MRSKPDTANDSLSLVPLWEGISSALLGTQPDQYRIQFVREIELKIHEDLQLLADRLSHVQPLVPGSRTSSAHSSEATPRAADSQRLVFDTEFFNCSQRREKHGASFLEITHGLSSPGKRVNTLGALPRALPHNR